MLFSGLIGVGSFFKSCARWGREVKFLKWFYSTLALKRREYFDRFYLHRNCGKLPVSLVNCRSSKLFVVGVLDLE